MILSTFENDGAPGWHSEATPGGLPHAPESAAPARAADPAPGPVAQALAEARRHPTPLYRPGRVARAFGWAGDLVGKLDPAPLGRASRALADPLIDRFGRLMEIPAGWLDALGRKGRIGRVVSRTADRAGLFLVPVAGGLEALGGGLGAAHRRFARGVEDGLGRLPLPRGIKELLWLSPPPRDVPTDGTDRGGFSVQARMKEMYSPVIWGSLILSVAVHVLAFGYAPEFQAEDLRFEAVELTAVEIPPEIDIPPPPSAMVRPATPVIATVPVDEDVTIAPTTFADNPVASLPPPPTETSSSGSEDPDIASAPTFTPFTVAPEIRNRDELIRLIRDVYHPTLRDAGIGGVVVVWFYIDEDGKVGDTRVAQSSGYEQLDAAALQVSDRFVFSPGILNDRFVPVWVQFPITFAVR